MNEALVLPMSTVALRLLAAFVLGGVIGLERERRDRPAGLRTHILVTVAAALLMMLSRYHTATGLRRRKCVNFGLI